MTESDSRSHRLRWWTLAVLGVAVMTAGLQNTIINVALPTLQKEFDASPTMLQWFVNSYILAYAGLLLVMGFVGDRYGRRRWLNVGLVVFGLGSAAAALAPTGATFLITQIAMGIGAATLTPATLSIIIDVFPKEERARAIGIWAGLAALGAGLGPLVGGALLEVLWYGSVFLISLPVVVAALLAGPLVVPESRDRDAPSIDARGAALSTLGILLLVYGVQTGPEAGWLKLHVLGALVGGALSLLAFVRHERSTEHPLLNIDFFKDRAFNSGAIAISLSFFALFAILFFATQFVQTVQGRTALEAGLVTAALALAAGVASSVAPRIVARLGVRDVVVAGMATVVVGLVFAALWPADATAAFVILTGIVFGLGAGLVVAPATSAIMDGVPEQQAGVGSGVSSVTRQVGGAIGIAILASIQATQYTDRVKQQLAGAPSGPLEVASDSVAGAHQIAAQLGGPKGPQLVDVANAAFVDGMHLALFVGAGLLATATVLLARYMSREERLREPPGLAPPSEVDV